jgi:hypothetical protein
MRIEAQQPHGNVHVLSGAQGVELRIGEPAEAGARATTLSLPQARMLLHALGFAVAEAEERQRVEAEERVGMTQRVLDQEFRRG